MTWFGCHVESLLSELDKNGRPRYTLDQLIDDPKPNGNHPILQQLIGAFGVEKRP